MCIYSQWSIDALYNGLKGIECKVVWSLRQNPEESLVLPKSDDSFWISKWIPQVEVLAHPAVKAGMTHCGFGGTLEFISNEVPFACWPHFGD